MSRTLPRASGAMPAKFVSRIVFVAGLAFTTVWPLTKCSAFYPTARRSQCDASTFPAQKSFSELLLLLMDGSKKNGAEKFSAPRGKMRVSLGCGCRSALGRGLGIAFPAHAYELGDAGLLHGDAIEDAAGLHGLAVVGYDDELRLGAHVGDEPGETADVGFIEWGVDFVEDAEGAGLIAEDGDQQGQRGHCFFTAGKQQHVLQALAGGRGHDVNARVAGAIGFGQAHFRGAAAEYGVKGVGKIGVDGGEGLFEAILSDEVEFLDGLLGVGDG